MALSRDSRIYRGLRSARNRAVITRKRLKGVHPTSYISPSCRVARDLATEEYVFLGPECLIGPITTIGRYTLFGPRVAIVGDDHIIDVIGTPMHFSGRPPQQPTIVGRDCWIGYGAVLMRGITIGEGSVVAAGAVVTKDVPPYEIWGGTPARKLRDRLSGEERDRHSTAVNGPLIAPSFAQPQPEALSRGSR